MQGAERTGAVAEEGQGGGRRLDESEARARRAERRRGGLRRVRLVHRRQLHVLLVVIGIGTFGLALAFSGNDLVNFIGVSMAAYHSYEAWVVSGIDASLFSMEVLDKKVPAEPFLLFLAGGIMVLTLWFSKKATTVLETTISLSRQRETHEKFNPNFLSRTLVSSSSWISSKVFNVLPNVVQNKIGKKRDVAQDAFGELLAVVGVVLLARARDVEALSLIHI